MAQTKPKAQTCRYHRMVQMPVRLEPLEPLAIRDINSAEIPAIKALQADEREATIARWKFALASTLSEWPTCELGGVVVFTFFEDPDGMVALPVWALCTRCNPEAMARSNRQRIIT